ncbi:MAG: PP2C family protein-serine/threonine phosphatase [Chloroflexota bacterium]
MSVPATTSSMVPATLSVTVAAATDAAGRAENEDAVIAAPLPPAAQGARAAGEPAFLLAVADGMGGPDGGERASALAVEALREAFAGGAAGDPAVTLRQAVRAANDAIWAEGGAHGGEPMGTTLTAAVVQGKFVAIASVGDSRAYLLRGPGITLVTKDHSLVAERIAAGALKPDEARLHPQRNVLTHAVGSNPKLDRNLPPVYELSLLPEDRLLLCSDGFYDVVTDAELAATLRGADADGAVAALVALAKDRGTTDNVSAVVAQAVPTRVAAALPAPSAEAGVGPRLLVAAIVVAAVIAIVAALLLLGFIP